VLKEEFGCIAIGRSGSDSRRARRSRW